MKLHAKHKRILNLLAAIALTLALGINMTACSSETSWKEEVLLHDGSKIIVTRSQIREGPHEIGQEPPIKEHSIIFTPAGTNKSITWKSEFTEDIGHANLDLLALEILNGTPYIATNPTRCLAYEKWGRPNPPYILFKYTDQQWKLIPLAELPAEFKRPNVVINTSREKDIKTEVQKSGFVSADSVKKINSSLVQKEYKIILREPLEAADLCPQYSRGPKAPILITPMTSSNKASGS